LARCGKADLSFSCALTFPPTIGDLSKLALQAPDTVWPPWHGLPCITRPSPHPVLTIACLTPFLPFPDIHFFLHVFVVTLDPLWSVLCGSFFSNVSHLGKRKVSPFVFKGPPAVKCSVYCRSGLLLPSGWKPSHFVPLPSGELWRCFLCLPNLPSSAVVISVAQNAGLLSPADGSLPPGRPHCSSGPLQVPLSPQPSPGFATLLLLLLANQTSKIPFFWFRAKWCQSPFFSEKKACPLILAFHSIWHSRTRNSCYRSRLRIFLALMKKRPQFLPFRLIFRFGILVPGPLLLPKNVMFLIPLSAIATQISVH